MLTRPINIRIDHVFYERMNRRLNTVEDWLNEFRASKIAQLYYYVERAIPVFAFMPYYGDFVHSANGVFRIGYADATWWGAYARVFLCAASCLQAEGWQQGMKEDLENIAQNMLDRSDAYEDEDKLNSLVGHPPSIILFNEAGYCISSWSKKRKCKTVEDFRLAVMNDRIFQLLYSNNNFTRLLIESLFRLERVKQNGDSPDAVDSVIRDTRMYLDAVISGVRLVGSSGAFYFFDILRDGIHEDLLALRQNIPLFFERYVDFSQAKESVIVTETKELCEVEL